MTVVMFGFFASASAEDEKSQHEAEWNRRAKEVTETPPNQAFKHWRAGNDGVDYPTLVRRIRFSPDGSILVAMDGDKAVVREVESGREIYRLNLNELDGGIDFSPNGKYLAIGVNNGKVNFYKSGTGKLVYTLDGVGEVLTVTSVKWFEEYVAVGDMANTVTVIHFPTKKVIFRGVTASFGPEVFSLAISHGRVNEMLVNARSLVRVVPNKGIEVLIKYPSKKGYSVDFHEGSKVALWEIKQDKLERRRFPSGRGVSRFTHEHHMGKGGEFTYSCFSKDGKYLVYAGDNGFLQLIDVTSGKQLWHARYGQGWLEGEWGHYSGSHLEAVDLHAKDGKVSIAASGDDADTVKIWKVDLKKVK